VLTAVELPVNAKDYANQLGVTLTHFARYVGLSEQSLSRKDRMAKPSVQSRLLDVQSILTRVGAWFDTPQQAWAWYTGKPIASFDNLTPAELVKIYGEKGITAIQDYISAKELGGYE